MPLARRPGILPLFKKNWQPLCCLLVSILPPVEDGVPLVVREVLEVDLSEEEPLVDL